MGESSVVPEREATPDEAHEIGYSKGHLVGWNEALSRGEVLALKRVRDYAWRDYGAYTGFVQRYIGGDLIPWLDQQIARHEDGAS